MRKERDLTWLIGWAALVFGVLVLVLVLFKIFTGTTPQIGNDGALAIVPVELSLGAILGQGIAISLSFSVSFFCLRDK